MREAKIGLLVLLFQLIINLPIIFCAVTLHVEKDAATISNSIITVKFDHTGHGGSLVYKGKELIGKSGKGFGASINGGTYMSAKSMKVVTNSSNHVDVAYSSDWGDLHYVVNEGVSGLYSYFVSTNIDSPGEFRTIYRPDVAIFTSGYNAERSGPFPSPAELAKAKTIQDATYELTNGTIFTKYDWATFVEDDRVHGLYGNEHGLFMISPSYEYQHHGPMKQDLMVHTDAVLLNMLHSGHGGGPTVKIPSGKIHGPWLVYVNTGSTQDALSQWAKEAEAWPYSWISDPKFHARSTVTGTLKLADGKPAAGATVVLGAHGGDLYTLGSDYTYWKRADSTGRFKIPHVRHGTYTLSAYANGGSIGEVTDQFEKPGIKVDGTTTDVGALTWSPKKYAHFLWQIGTADRRCTEFHLGADKRTYGHFKEVPPTVEFTIGQSKEAQNWYYAITHNGTWNVHFSLTKGLTGTAHLTVAVAGAARKAHIEVDVNGKSVGLLPGFPNDSQIYRSGNKAGYYHSTVVSFPATDLKAGSNTIAFKGMNVDNGGGIMWDTIKLEVE